MLQKLSARFGTRVAFVGINSQDEDEDAARWLEQAPVPYPSYTDSNRKLAQSFGAIGLPATAFIDREGDLIRLQQGYYGDEAQLEAEIEELVRKST